MSRLDPIDPAVAASMPLLILRSVEVYRDDDGRRFLGILQDHFAVEQWLRRQPPCQPVIVIERLRGARCGVWAALRWLDGSIDWLRFEHRECATAPDPTLSARRN
ncbi:MAG: hypothetical protein ACYDCI_00325 [Candidatus Limnocylindrales bacterium]